MKEAEYSRPRAPFSCCDPCDRCGRVGKGRRNLLGAPALLGIGDLEERAEVVIVLGPEAIVSASAMPVPRRTSAAPSASRSSQPPGNLTSPSQNPTAFSSVASASLRASVAPSTPASASEAASALARGRMRST